MWTKPLTKEDADEIYSRPDCERYALSSAAESDCQALLPVEVWVSDVAIAIYADEPPVAYNDLEDLFIDHGLDFYRNDLLIKK